MKYLKKFENIDIRQRGVASVPERERETIHIHIDRFEDLYWEETDKEYKKVYDQNTYHEDEEVWNELVIKRLSDGKFFKTEYSQHPRNGTDFHEDKDGMVEFDETFPKQIITTIYEQDENIEIKKRHTSNTERGSIKINLETVSELEWYEDDYGNGYNGFKFIDKERVATGSDYTHIQLVLQDISTGKYYAHTYAIPFEGGLYDFHEDENEEVEFMEVFPTEKVLKSLYR